MTARFDSDTFAVMAIPLSQEAERKAMSQTPTQELYNFVYRKLQCSHDLQRVFLCGVLDELRNVDFDGGDEWYHAGRMFIADLIAGREPALVPTAVVDPAIIATALRLIQAV